MSTLSLSPFSSSPLHSFRLPKSSSGRSQSGCGEADWSMPGDAYPQSSALPSSDSFPPLGSFTAFAPSSFGALGASISPSFLSPLDAAASSPALASPKFFSPLDTLSSPRRSAPLHPVSPVFSSPLAASTASGSSSSLTSSLSARRQDDGHTARPWPTSPPPPTAIVSSSAQPTLATAAAEAPLSGPSKLSPPASRSPPRHAPNALPSSPSAAAVASATAAAPSSALSDMSNYLTFEVLNIDSVTGQMTTEETPFSPANAAVFDFVAMHQPLADALAPAPRPSEDYGPMPLDDAEALIHPPSTPTSPDADDDDEAERMDRFASPPTSFFTPSPPQHYQPPLDAAPFTPAPFYPPGRTGHRALSRPTRTRHPTRRTSTRDLRLP